MRRRQFFWLLFLLAAAAGVIGIAEYAGTAPQEETAQEAMAYEKLFADAPVAQLEGERLSPNGRFKARTVGKSDTCISGLRLPERLEIADTETGAVLWEDMGYLRQSVRWSPEGRYLALAYGGRTWGQVKIIETENWTAWSFTLPDGSPIPEYTFLPEDWGVWRDENTLELTVGRGGDGEEQHGYRCFFRMEDGSLTGSTMEQTTEPLPQSWDFDHDGVLETAEVVLLWGGMPDTNHQNLGSWDELVLKRQDGTIIWSEEAALSHVGWNTIAACTVDGQDYLMRYQPAMFQGMASYVYQLFSLDAAGEEILLRENRVEFDISFGAPHHMAFDAGEIADFLWEVREYLEQSTVLLTTLDGEFSSNIPGLELRYYPFGDLLALDSREATETAVRRMEAAWKTDQGVS